MSIQYELALNWSSWIFRTMV